MLKINMNNITKSFHENNVWVARQITDLLYKRLPNKKSKTQEHRKFLFDCMDRHGYIAPPQIVSESESEESDQEPQEPFYQENYQEPGYQENYSTVTGTSIAPGSTNKRLYEVQKYIITQEEQEMADLSDLFDTVLNKLKYTDVPLLSVKQMALGMYNEIKRVYRETNDIKGEIKGSVKLGYTLLVLYYALINHKICVSRTDLVVYFDNKITLSDLPKADKNIQMIFGETVNHELCLCGMRNLFDKPTLNAIENGIHELKNNGKFNNPATQVQVAAAIHYFAKTPLKTIQGYCGITADTIRKTVSLIQHFFTS